VAIHVALAWLTLALALVFGLAGVDLAPRDMVPAAWQPPGSGGEARRWVWSEQLFALPTAGRRVNLLQMRAGGTSAGRLPLLHYS
jgi:hypothetical protein